MKTSTKWLIVLILLLFIVIFSTDIHAQRSITYEINTIDTSHRISPYIYGDNGQLTMNITSHRLGGNRLTGYNWENNFSNAGADYFHHSDNYIPYTLGIPESEHHIPAISFTKFIEDGNERDLFSLITLQMGGYVARDDFGTVEESETAPSDRWDEVRFRIDNEFNAGPDLTDGKVYLEELLDWMISRLGNSSSPTGVRAYSLDNEPALWLYTHPRIHPTAVTYEELKNKSISLAHLIKDKDVGADVFGPSLYGFYAFYNLQDAPDAINHSEYPWFLSYYLDKMKMASDSLGVRLLDVLDLHWYPEPEGVYAGDVSTPAVLRRINAPRSLWDETYIEESWITIFLGTSINLLLKVQQDIDQYNPGTKIAITEYDYGAAEHISGGIAQVEALAAFIRQNVYFASKWNETHQYVQAGYNLFTNFDGNGNSFGDVYINSVSPDRELTSIVNSLNSNTQKLHSIITNRSLTEAIDATISLNNSEHNHCKVYAIVESDTNVIAVDSFPVSNSQVIINIPPLSAYHLVFENKTVVSVNKDSDNKFDVYPSPAEVFINVELSVQADKIEIHNHLGQLIKTVDKPSLAERIDIRNFGKGNYIISIHKNKVITTKQFLKM